MSAPAVFEALSNEVITSPANTFKTERLLTHLHLLDQLILDLHLP